MFKRNELTEEQRFNYCVNIILEHEGGLSLDKRDPGGVTQWGVSLRFLRATGFDIDKDGDIDADDVLALGKPDAKEIYKKYWWDRFRYQAINSLGVASKVFDMAVNMGAMAAHKVLQQAINRISNNKLQVDGILGKKTIDAINSQNDVLLREQLRMCCKEKYIKIVADKPHMHWALKGWLHRAEW